MHKKLFITIMITALLSALFLIGCKQLSGEPVAPKESFAAGAVSQDTKSVTMVITADALGSEKTVSAVTTPATIYIPLGDLVDFEKEIARLQKEIDNMQKEIARAEGKLNNQGFVAKAPAALVEQEKAKLALNRQKLEQLEKRMAELKESM